MDKLPLENEIERDIEYGSTVAKLSAELIDLRNDRNEILRGLHLSEDDNELQAKQIVELLKERDELKMIVASLQKTSARLAHEKSELQGIIENARLAFDEINKRATVLAKTLEDLKSML